MAASDGSISQPPGSLEQTGDAATVEHLDRDKRRHRPTSLTPLPVTALRTTGQRTLPLDGWTAVVLAAGQGTRMRSLRPKVLHEVAGRPMLLLLLDALAAAGCARSIVVAASEDGAVAEAARAAGALVARQQAQRGTADAALAARDAAGEAPRVLIVHADLPLLTASSLGALANAHLEAQATISLLTVELDDPSGYGRIVRTGGSVSGIVEETETDAQTRPIREVNVGLYAAEAAWLWPALAAIEPSPRGELYLPDAVRAALADGRPVLAHPLADASEAQQVNTRAELALAEATQRQRVRARLMASGVTIVDPPTTYIDSAVEVGADTTLLPGTHLLGATVVGSECAIGPSAVLRDMRVGERCSIGGSTLEQSTLGDDVRVGPYSHIRPGSTIEAGAQLGNYAEVKASRIGARTKVGHFSYLGDADVGADVNIGAGTITANYDGTDHNATTIGDGAFIGSDSMLVAPLTIGAGARTGVGSVVTRDVPPGAAAIGAPARIRQSSAAAGGEGG